MEFHFISGEVEEGREHKAKQNKLRVLSYFWCTGTWLNPGAMV